MSLLPLYGPPIEWPRNATGSCKGELSCGEAAPNHTQKTQGCLRPKLRIHLRKGLRCSEIGLKAAFPILATWIPPLVGRANAKPVEGWWVPDLRLRRRSQGSSSAATLQWKTPASKKSHGHTEADSKLLDIFWQLLWEIQAGLLGESARHDSQPVQSRERCRIKHKASAKTPLLKLIYAEKAKYYLAAWSQKKSSGLFKLPLQIHAKRPRASKFTFSSS